MSLLVFSANTAWYLHNFRRNTLRAFLDLGHEVIAMAPPDAYADKLEKLGCRFIPLSMVPSSRNPWNEMRAMFAYFRTYRRLHPVMVFHFTTKCNLYGSFVARILGIPYVNNVAGLGRAFDSRNVFDLLVRHIYRFTQSGARRVFFQNQSDFARLTIKGGVSPERAEVIPGSGVDLKHFQPHSRPPSDTFTFVYAGRILWEKGFPYLPEAMKLLRINKPKVECLIFGFTDERDPKCVPLKTLRVWETQGLIRYRGPLEDVREAYSQADCLVLPSFYREGIPRSLLEGAAMSKPIVATDWVGCREVVTDGVNGYLCRIKDAQSLADTMLKMVEAGKQKQLEMGAFGRMLMERHFDEKIILEKYLDILSTL